jgi:hypothetical protein
MMHRLWAPTVEGCFEPARLRIDRRDSSSSYRVERWARARFMIVSELNGSERRFARILCPYLKGPRIREPAYGCRAFLVGPGCSRFVSPECQELGPHAAERGAGTRRRCQRARFPMQCS